MILDPVLVATSGTPLLAADALHVMRLRLLPLVDCLTPNLAEAGALLGRPCACNESDMVAQAHGLLALGARAVLMKGGHAALPEAIDLLVTAHGVWSFAESWVDTHHLHGTGCMLSAGIAAGLASGRGLADAVDRAKTHLHAVLVSRQRAGHAVARA